MSLYYYPYRFSLEINLTLILFYRVTIKRVKLVSFFYILITGGNVHFLDIPIGDKVPYSSAIEYSTRLLTVHPNLDIILMSVGGRHYYEGFRVL